VCPEGWPPKPLFPPFRKCRKWRDGKFTSTRAEKLLSHHSTATFCNGNTSDFLQDTVQGDWGDCGHAGQSSLGRRSLVIVCSILFLSPWSSLMASVCAHCTTLLFRSLVSSCPPHGVCVCTPHNSSLFSGQANSCLPDRIYMSSAYLNTLVHRQPCVIMSLAKCTSTGSRCSVPSY